MLLNTTQQQHEPGTADAGATGFFERMRLPIHAGRRLLAAVLLIACGGVTHAALIEIPGYQPDWGLVGDGRRHLPSWEGKAQRSRLDTYGILPANAAGLVRLGYPEIGMTHPRDIRGRTAESANGSPIPDSDPYAAIDAPYGTIGAPMPSTGDADPELWTVLLVAAGLIAYQVRRKSRVGAIRVRPLQY
jgi:hypothetical protein